MHNAEFSSGKKHAEKLERSPLKTKNLDCFQKGGCSWVGLMFGKVVAISLQLFIFLGGNLQTFFQICHVI